MTQLKVPKGKNKTTFKNSKEFCIWWTYVSKCTGNIPHLDKTWANLLSRKLHYKNAKWPSLEQRDGTGVETLNYEGMKSTRNDIDMWIN